MINLRCFMWASVFSLTFYVLTFWNLVILPQTYQSQSIMVSSFQTREILILPALCCFLYLDIFYFIRIKTQNTTQNVFYSETHKRCLLIIRKLDLKYFLKYSCRSQNQVFILVILTFESSDQLDQKTAILLQLIITFGQVCAQDHKSISLL